MRGISTSALHATANAIVFRISSLSNFVAQNANLTKLVLRKMNLGPEDSEKIVTALLSNTSVQLSYLDLSDNPIGVRFALLPFIV